MTSLRIAALAILVLLAPAAGALPDDRRQAIAITAAKAIRDEKKGFTIYSGDVVLDQGSLHIEAETLTIFHDREAADRIVAVGEPARLRQQPEVDKAVVTASAGRIEYLKSTEVVLLREAAKIEQDGAMVTGESIDYLMAEQRVRADAGADDDSARVQVFIPAEVLATESQDEETAPQAQDPGSDRSAPAPDAPGAADPGDTPVPDPNSGRGGDAGASAATPPAGAASGEVSGGNAQRP